MLSLGQLPLLIGFSLYGGSLADAHDRRRLLVFANIALASTSVGLALNASLSTPQVWPLYVLTALSAGFSGLDSPTRSAAVPTLVRRDQIAAAAALNQTGYQVGQIAGPAVAGLLIANVDIAAAYWVDVATFMYALWALWRMQPMRPEGGGTKAGLRSIGEGLRYLKGERAVQGCFLIDINAMVFGMPRALFPQLGTQLFGGGAGAVGLLYAAPGVGAMLGAVTTGWVSGVRRPGRAVQVAVVLWGLAIAGFGFATWLPLALLLLAVAGAADVVSAVFRGTILQLQVPDRLRGRLNAVNIAVVTGGPRLGDLESGAVASVVDARFAVVSGGLACVAGVGVLARVIPELGRWVVPSDPAPVTLPDRP